MCIFVFLGFLRCGLASVIAGLGIRFSMDIYIVALFCSDNNVYFCFGGFLRCGVLVAAVIVGLDERSAYISLRGGRMNGSWRRGTAGC